MNPSYIAHKQYVRAIVNEMYPDANLNRDMFLIIQPILRAEYSEENQADEMCCMVDIYDRDKKRQISLYPALSHPYQNRDVAIAGSRYGSVPASRGTPAKEYYQQLLRIEDGKKISDIGLVLRLRDYEELVKIETIKIIWDYEMGTSTILYIPSFRPPRNRENCYLLRVEVPENWKEKPKSFEVQKNENRQCLYIRENQSNGKAGYVHCCYAGLRPSPWGENIKIAGASKKFARWQKRIGGELI